MEIQLATRLRGDTRGQWEALLNRTGLLPEEPWDQTALVWEGDTLVAAGSRLGNLLKCIAVDPDRRGEDLTARVLSALRREAFREGHRQLFLYTKPENEGLFRGLFFYPVAATDRVLLMEDRPGGLERFLDSLPAPPCQGTVGAAVMHCDPFTLGHRHLIETAAGECDRVLVFVLSEDRGRFPAGDRLELVRRGTRDLPNVTVLPTGPYLISQATFPTYFLKDRQDLPRIRCDLDLELFAGHYAPRFGITCRYVGQEPFCPVTEQYNRALEAALPPRGIRLRVVPRLEGPQGPISAGAVRRMLAAGEDPGALLPEVTRQYLEKGGL